MNKEIWKWSIGKLHRSRHYWNWTLFEVHIIEYPNCQHYYRYLGFGLFWYEGVKWF